MSSSPSVPNVPNPTNVAAQQQTYNTGAGIQSQEGSMVNQSNPYGNLNYSQTGTSADGTPIYSANTTLSQPNQQLLSVLQGTQGAAGTAGQNLIKGANYGAVSPSSAIGDATSGLTQQAMQKETSYLNPYFTTQTDQLDTKLRNQGFAPGQPGYDNAMRGLQNNQGNTVTGFEAQIEPQMFQQAQASYLLPAQLGGTLAGLGSPTQPTFNATPQLNINPADYTGAVSSANQANMAAYNAQLGQSNAMMSGLFGVPTAVLGGLAKNGSMTGLSGLFSGAGAAGAGAADAGLASLEALGPAAII